ncbi:MAG: DUF3107 domain-containing protein [Dermatophilaceae bacterium]
MEVKIGIANVAREISIEPEMTSAQVQEAVAEAISSGSTLRLEDAKGRVVLVPGAAIGFIDIGESTKSRVGFGA